MALSKNILDKTKKAIPSIEKVSIELLIESYNLIILKKEYDLDWEEEQFSAYLISQMNKQPLTKKYHLHIDIEKKLLDENNLPLAENNPKYLPRIDISIASWLFEENEKLKYFFEAKNLCENNWNKSCGSVVNAYKYQKRYITTGIENFRIARYYNGAIIGYILQGNIVNIITKLNYRLLTDTNTIQEIRNLVFILDYNDVYNSKHITPLDKHIEIKHLFLKF